MKTEKILKEMAYELASGTHTFTMCKCGRTGCRSGRCIYCLAEDLLKTKKRCSDVFIERAAQCTREGIRAICGTDEEYSEYVKKFMEEKANSKSL